MPTRTRPRPRQRLQHDQTPLEALSLARGWSYQRVADEIHRHTGKKVSATTVYRLARGLHKPSRLTQEMLDKFFTAVAA